MKNNITILIIFLSLLIIVSCKQKSDNPETPSKTKENLAKIVIKDKRIRQSPPTTKMAAGYMIIYNKTAVTDTLISAKCDISDTLELHNMTHENGVMKMRKVEGIDIPANSSTELKPGGYHLMFINLKGKLNEGDRVKLELNFKNAGTYIISAKVDGSNTQSHTHDHSPELHKHTVENHPAPANTKTK